LAPTLAAAYGRDEIVTELGVELQPESGIFLHLPTEAVGMQREAKITVTPLHNFFGPRLAELPGLVPSLPVPRTACGRASSAPRVVR